MSKRQIGFVLFSIFVLFAFQNCGPSFRAQVGTETLSSQTTPPGGNGDEPPPGATPVPGPGLTPTPAPSATPALKVLTETRVYFGGISQIQGFRINHANDSVTKLGRYTMNTGGIGWMNYEPSLQTFLALDAGNLGRFSLNKYAPATGVLSGFMGYGDGPNSIHSTLIKGTTGFIVYSADYSGGNLSKHNFNANMELIANSAVVTGFGAGAKTHSSAYDSKRNLLYVANLGLNVIFIYKANLTSGALTRVGTLTVDSPRTVVYDAIYDKLYLATEASAVSSFIYAYSITEVGNTVTLQGVGSLAMPLIAADLKVDRKNGFVLATARENGKESVWGMPVNGTGVQDTSRPAFSFLVNQPAPRALEISEDGKYVFVGMSASTSTNNVQIYKMTYDAASRFVSAQLIYENLTENGQFLCSLSIPIYQ